MSKSLLQVPGQVGRNKFCSAEGGGWVGLYDFYVFFECASVVFLRKDLSWRLWQPAFLKIL